MTNHAHATKVTFVSSAFNEQDNLLALYERCLSSFDQLARSNLREALAFEMILVDNCSSDKTVDVIRELMARDPRIKGIRNRRNYGPEPSFIQGLALANSADIIILLCADLQDPPEIAVDMLDRLIHAEAEHDAIVAYKVKSAGNAMVRLLRKVYYKLLRFSNRDSMVLPGYHGFGCYRAEVVSRALRLWRTTPMNMRGCFSSSIFSPLEYPYVQPDRVHGSSSYSLKSYFSEASQAISAGKSLASRISMRLGLAAFMLSLILAVFTLINYSTGRSGYAPGIPSLVAIIVLSSSFQFIMLSLVSRQIEQGLNRPMRPRVKFQKL